MSEAGSAVPRFLQQMSDLLSVKTNGWFSSNKLNEI